MLAISRKVGESFYMFYDDKQIIVQLLRMDRGQVRLGIEAPKEVTILREELLGDRK